LSQLSHRVAINSTLVMSPITARHQPSLCFHQPQPAPKSH
jgi:hypothetical protein